MTTNPYLSSLKESLLRHTVDCNLALAKARSRADIRLIKWAKRSSSPSLLENLNFVFSLMAKMDNMQTYPSNLTLLATALELKDAHLSPWEPIKAAELVLNPNLAVVAKEVACSKNEYIRTLFNFRLNHEFLCEVALSYGTYKATPRDYMVDMEAIAHAAQLTISSALFELVASLPMDCIDWSSQRKDVLY